MICGRMMKHQMTTCRDEVACEFRPLTRHTRPSLRRSAALGPSVSAKRCMLPNSQSLGQG